MRFSICNEIFSNWRWENICKFVSEVGYHGIEVAPFTLAPDVRKMEAKEIEEIRETAGRYNLRIVGLHWLLVSPPGLHVFHPDEKIRRETALYMRSLVDLCHGLGGSIMVFGSPKQRDIPPSLTYEEAWRRMKDFLLFVLQEAEKKDVFICLEPLSSEETNFLNTAEEAVRMIEEIGHPHLGLNLDVKAMSTEKEPMEKIIRKSGKYLRHFHANDANRRGPGFGDTSFQPIAKALKEIDYQGYVSVEVFDVFPDPVTCAIKSLQYLKEVFAHED